MKISQKLINLLAYQWKMKLYLLLLACLLWVFVVNNQNYETIVEVPLKPVNIKPLKIVASELPSTVEVRFSGKGMDLLVLEYIQPPCLELDLHTISYFYDYPLNASQIITPPGMNVTVEAIVSPETVKVILEDEMISKVQVKPDVRIALQPGYMQVGMITTLPDCVTVSGPKSLMRQLNSISTEERVFNNVRKPVSESVPVILPDPQRMKASPRQVRVNAEIDKIAERKIGRIPVGVIRIPMGRRAIVEPSTINVTLRGPAQRLAGMTSDSVDAFVNLTRWNPNRKDYPPEFNLPMGLEMVWCEPESVQVRVEVR